MAPDTKTSVDRRRHVHTLISIERKFRTFNFARLAGARKSVPARLSESQGTRSRNLVIVGTNATVAANAPPPERAAEVALPPPLRTRIPVTSATIIPVRIAITTSAALMPFGPIFVLPLTNCHCQEYRWRLRPPIDDRRGPSAARVAPGRSGRPSQRRGTDATNIRNTLLQGRSGL